MAGVEKVCEYSGEHGGYKMYEYKRNGLQIMPQYRKLFRGCNAVLYIRKEEEDPLHFKHKGCYYDLIDYCFLVRDNHLQGTVHGFYFNWTIDTKMVIRKLKRITRNYKLKVVYLNEDKWDDLKSSYVSNFL